jgi:NAD(P)-dependent dehydrogenase (short-subunit alcohol dehydrogenase family)
MDAVRCDQRGISALVANVFLRTGKIDLLVNNPGIGMFGGV